MRAPAAFFVLLALSLAGCQSLSPKGIGIGIDIDFAKAPTAKEARQWRKSQKWQPVSGGWVNVSERSSTVLIKGNPVDKAKYPAVIRITSASGSGCTASIVGPQAILTAAHCASPGEKVTFKTHDGRSFSAIMTRYEQWPGDDLDLSVGKVDAVINGIVPLVVRVDRFEKKGMLVDLLGYGCTEPGGTGGNDGVLRKGAAKVSGGQGYDLALDASPSALCYGDSGGPVLFEGKQIGVNSKGNIVDKSYTTRTTLPESKAWLEKISASLEVSICGISAECDDIIPPPGPRQFSFENEDVKISGTIKK